MRRTTPYYKFNQQTANLLFVYSAPIRRVHKQLHESQIWWHMCKIYIRFSEKMVPVALFSPFLPSSSFMHQSLSSFLFMYRTISYFTFPKLLTYLCTASLSFVELPYEQRKLGCHLLIQTYIFIPYSCLLVVLGFLVEKYMEKLENNQ